MTPEEFARGAVKVLAMAREKERADRLERVKAAIRPALEKAATGGEYIGTCDGDLTIDGIFDLDVLAREMISAALAEDEVTG